MFKRGKVTIVNHCIGKRIALALPIGVPHIQRIVQGIVRYSKSHGEWRLIMSPEALRMSIESLSGWNGDGIIARISTEKEANVANALGIPVVNMSGAFAEPPLPQASVDNHAIGRLAAQHLLACGFERFAFYGVRGLHYSHQRRHAFVQAITAAGGSCSALEGPSSFDSDWLRRDVDEQLQRWLAELQPPIGLFACSDNRASMVIEVCDRVGLDVPNQVAVLGVDNDEVVCEACSPPLSSISCNNELNGYSAAQLLDELMSGNAPRELTENHAGNGLQTKNPVVLTPPNRVVKRVSTDTISIEDPKTAAAVQFVRDNLGQSIGVAEVSRAVNVSRRWIEQSFQRWVGCTPHEYITQARVDRAKMLLVSQPPLTLGQVAKRCGFPSVKRLRAVFQQYTDSSPLEYRRNCIEEMNSK